MAILENREALEKLRNSLQAKHHDNKKKLISLCAGSGCGAYGTAKVHQTLLDELVAQDLHNEVEVKLSGCHGFCEKGPIMVIHPEGIFYPQLKEKHIPEIVEKTIKNGELVKKLIFKDPATKKKITHEKDIPFYKLQQRIIFGNNGIIDSQIQKLFRNTSTGRASGLNRFKFFLFGNTTPDIKNNSP